MEKTQLANSEIKVLHLALMGGIDARKPDGAINIGYAKLHGLLAFLAMSGGIPLRRDHLAALFWPEMPPTAGRQNLRRALFNLKSALGDAGQLLSAERDMVTLACQGLWLDAAELTTTPALCASSVVSDKCAPCLAQMEYQAGLYRGEFMAGFSLPECSDLADWLQIQRETLHRRALSLLEKLSNCHEQAGDYTKALHFALRYIELEPWDEYAHRKAMHLYALNGQNSAAMRQYETCCRLLEKELGALPSKETQHLAERIRNGEVKREPAATATTAIPQALMERRQVTILYCELTPAEADDPDEAMAKLHAPQARCVKIIREFSGHIVQTHGGGLLAYFGYPKADEHAARRAVQAALTITSEAANGIEIRAGVHTGLIIAGGDSSMPDSVGKTSRFAIQLRHGVAHNEVAISPETRTIVDGYFDCASLGVQKVPGFAQPVEIFKVLRESGARTRLDATAQLTPFTGRKAEITQLMKLWNKAIRGMRQVVLIQGEAGIGKSRLLHALKLRLADKPYAMRELRCFPEFSQSPFHPVISMLEAVFGFEHNNSREEKFGKLAKYLETHYPGTALNAIPLLATLLSLPLGGDYQPSAVPPQKQKEQTIAILLDLLHVLAEQQPVLFIVEDLHWIDPSTLELLSLFVEQAREESVLALLTARPEFDPPWNEISDTTLELEPLSNEEAGKMVASISRKFSDSTVRHIIAQADGVPLFVEEMAKVASMGGQSSIPSTLQDILAARMDSIGHAKYTAQLAATIGRAFDLNLLRKVSPYDSATLKHELSALQDAGLIFQMDDTTCQFKHALLQEAACQSQAKPDRQAAHQRIAQALLDGFPEVATTQPEVIAQHLAAAGETQQAIEYWIKAGQRAVQSSANLEASGHFNSGLQLLMSLPADQDRDKTEFTILTHLCPVLYATKGYGSEEATRANARLSNLSELFDDSPESFLAEWARVMNTIAGVGSRDVPQAAIRLLEMSHGDLVREQAAHYAVADAAFWLGDFATTRTHTEQALALYRPEQHRVLLERYNEDLSVSCAAYLAWSLYFLGDPEQAQQVCDKMLGRARELDHPHTLALALCFASVLHRWLNKRAETLRLSAETIAVSRKQDFSVWLAAGEMTHGWALAMHGHKKEGIAELQSSIAGMKVAIGGISIVFLSALIEAYVHLGMYGEALNLIEEAQADVVRTGDGHYTTELHRLKGECLLALSPANIMQAEICFNQALAISRKQNSNLLQLRVATSMARMCQMHGNRQDAKQILEEIYALFTEGFETHDLQEATELLHTLV